jgi:hypothetical protein
MASKIDDPAFRHERAKIARRALTDLEYRRERHALKVERAVAEALPSLTAAERERIAALLRGDQ